MLLNDIVQAVLEECPVENQKYTDEVAEEAKGQRVEFDTVTFVRCRFTACDFPTVPLGTAIGKTQRQRAVKGTEAGFPIPASSG